MFFENHLVWLGWHREGEDLETVEKGLPSAFSVIGRLRTFLRKIVMTTKTSALVCNFSCTY